ncbi:MAG: VOC family protein [Candidatus Latescibacteria bacterium]|nr:VOC family protein [Candidatus Latescibacterota bacterium]
MPRIAHFDISSKEPEKTMEFFTKVFDWKFNNWGGPFEYWLITTGPDNKPGINGGLSKGEPSTAVVNTIDVESLDDTIKMIEAHGGKITQPKGPIPGVGWYAAFQSPDGNAFGIMQDDPNAK